MLAWTIYLSFLGAAAVTLTPRSLAGVIRSTALLTALAGLGIAVVAVLHGDPSGQLTTIANMPWIPSMGISYHLQQMVSA